MGVPIRRPETTIPRSGGRPTRLFAQICRIRARVTRWASQQSVAVEVFADEVAVGRGDLIGVEGVVGAAGVGGPSGGVPRGGGGEAGCGGGGGGRGGGGVGVGGAGGGGGGGGGGGWGGGGAGRGEGRRG